MTRFVAGFIGSPAMNFVPCQLAGANGGLKVNVGDGIALPVPGDRTARYSGHVGKEQLVLGLRPEHLTEVKVNGDGNLAPFEAAIEVVEPMGMETLVFFRLGGTEICGRVNPDAPAKVGERMRLCAHMRHMHLIDEASGRVL